MKKYFLQVAKLTLVLVYLVIVAGAMVRMTGSGMGCPDWPKCFGYYIPPTDIKELLWAPGREFESGQVIIREQALWVAKEDFTTGKEYDASKWRPYTKHDYAVFNPTHTWIEYINRLFGALAGLATLAMAIISRSYWRTNKKITILSWLAVLLMGFQGWLGATVVYSVLNPVKITIHMVVALVIVALILYIIRAAKEKHRLIVKDRFFTILIVLALLLSLVQIILGTQVRQFVDEQVRILGYDRMGEVMANPTVNFYVHRTFSVLIFGINLILYMRNKTQELGYKTLGWVMTIVVLEIVSGIAIYYNDFPFGSQAFHLVAASLMFGFQFHVLLAALGAKAEDKVDSKNL